MWRCVALAVAAVLLGTSGCGGGDRETGGTGTDQSTTSDGDTGTDGGDGTSTRCAERAGMVKGYVPVIERDECDPRVLLLGERLYSADQLTTGPVGQLEFEAGRLDLCTTWPGTVVVVRPDDETLLRLVSGTIACSATPGGEERLEVPGAVILVRGTLFTLAASGDETTIKVHEGTLDVSSTSGSADPTPVSGLKQTVASEGQELEPADYVVDAVESERLTALRLGIVSLPSDALAGFTAEAGADVTVVTETDDQSEHLVERGIVERFQPLTTSAIGRRSRGELGLRSDTVVGVGSFANLADAFAQLRATLGAGATLVYTPFAFPETTTETTTETDTTPTETEPVTTETTQTETASP